VTALRLFFALRPAPEQNAYLAELAAPLATQLAGQLSRAANLHATLCFVGTVEPARLEALRDAAASVRSEPIEMCFDALEYWEKPQILCATASGAGDESRVNALSLALTAAILAAGFSPDVKPLRVHVTLARKIRAAQAATIEWPLPLLPPLLVRCDRFDLMQSRREESGSVYSVVDTWHLYR